MGTTKEPPLPLRTLTTEDLAAIDDYILRAERMMNALENPNPAVITGGNRQVVTAHWFLPTLRGKEVQLSDQGCAYHYYAEIATLLRRIKRQCAIFLDDDIQLATFQAPKQLRLNPQYYYRERSWYT